MEKEVGILCHISSLPSEYGVGSFGKEAYKFVNFLAENDVRVWQILPLSQTGETNCPYYCNCYFSYDEMFFDVDDIVAQNLITKNDASKLAKLPKAKKVLYDVVKRAKAQVFEKAFDNISKEMTAKVEAYLDENEDVRDYAIYKALLEKNGVNDWRLLEKNLLNKRSKDYNQFVADNKTLILKFGFYQYVLNYQWQKLKKYANDHRVTILGDLPIYPNVMSFDVFSERKAYQLDKNFNMLCTGGVPKNTPKDIEQNWGSSVYDWNFLKETDYEYLIKKIKMLLKKFDVLRLDHFYGYVEHYEFSTTNSADNKWVKAGGMDFFSRLDKQIDINKVVVENLGFIKKECDKVIKKYDLTGMCLLQDCLDDSRYLPSNVTENNIYYAGTHDNNTFVGFYENLDEKSKQKFCELLKIKENKNAKKVLVCALKKMYESKAKYVVFQIQDLLKQGSFYRMNTPGIAFDQWEYKMPKHYQNKAKNTLKLIKK